MITAKRQISFVFSFLVIYQVSSQHLIAEDLKTNKERKVKIGKELGVFTKTDTLYCITEEYNSITNETDFKYTGDWILTSINSKKGTIQLTNNMDGKIETINTNEIVQLIFRRQDNAKHKQLILGAFTGGLIWSVGASNEQDGQKIAGLTISALCAIYMAATWTWPMERTYKFVRIEK
jgi:hypothetical protein